MVGENSAVPAANLTINSGNGKWRLGESAIGLLKYTDLDALYVREKGLEKLGGEIQVICGIRCSAAGADGGSVSFSPMRQFIARHMVRRLGHQCPHEICAASKMWAMCIS